MRNRAILITSLIGLLTGCAAFPDYQLVAVGTDMNYLTFDHPFTDKANGEVLASAQRLCAQRKQAAIQTSRACSLTKCTTNYQCIEGAGVTKHGL